MQTLTNTVASKLAVAFVAIAMALTLAAPAAQAQSAEDMSLEELIALVNQLQGQIGGDSEMKDCPHFSRDLGTGSTGQDVKDLQEFLNMDPDTRVALSGVGSAGMETMTYGPLTAAAVSKFQVKYRSEILTPLGLVNATGYFGASSRDKANKMCAGDDGVDEDDDEDDDDDSNDDDDELQGGESEIQDVEGRGEEDDITEGEEDVEIYSVEFDVEDGDARLERVDVRLDAPTGTSDNEDEPWDAFEEISIWIDGDKVASEDVTDEDDWDEAGSTEVYTYRISGIDTIFREDETGEIVIALSAQNGVDISGTSSENEWVIDIPQNGMRFRDSVNVDIQVPTAAAGTDDETFEITEEGEDDDLDLESSTEDPDAATLEIDEDDEIEHMIFAFELSAEDSENDIDVDEVTINVLVGGDSGTSLDAFIDDFRIEVDGESVDAESYTGSGTSASIVFETDNEDISIDADDSATVMVYANFDDVASSFDFATITASTSASDIEAEGADDVTVDGSTKTSDVHTVRLEGLNIGDVLDGDDSSDSNHVENTDTPGNSYGTMFLTYDITAFGDDLFIPTNSVARTATASSTVGVTYTIENSETGAALATGTTSVTYDIAGASESGGYYELEDGETYEMTVNVNSYNPTAEGTYNFQLVSVGFNDTEAAADTAEEVSDENDYESDAVFITS